MKKFHDSTKGWIFFYCMIAFSDKGRHFLPGLPLIRPHFPRTSTHFSSSHSFSICPIFFPVSPQLPCKEVSLSRDLLRVPLRSFLHSPLWQKFVFGDLLSRGLSLLNSILGPSSLCLTSIRCHITLLSYNNNRWCEGKSYYLSSFVPFLHLYWVFPKFI